MCEGRLKAVFAMLPSAAKFHCFKEILFSISSTIIVAAKTFRAALEFTNAHLQQRDQVASKLRTVDFWLLVRGNTRVLTVATK